MSDSQMLESNKLIQNYIIIKKKYSDEELKELNISNEIYVLCNRTKNIIDKEFYQMDVSEEIFNKVSNYLMIYKVSINMLTNKQHNNNIIYINKNNFSKFNIFDYNLEKFDHFCIIPILNIQFITLQPYLDNYSKLNQEVVLSLNYNIVSIDKFFNATTDYNNYNFIPTYWQKINNLNLSNNFVKRNFKIDINRLDLDDNNYKIIKKIFNSSVQSNYLNDINYKQFNNTSLIILKEYPQIDIKSVYSDNDITQILLLLLSNTNDINKLYLIYNLLVSREYCHHIINFNTLSIFNDLNSKFKISKYIQQYFLSYTWITLYLDESILGKNIKTSDNIVIDINTASLLPVYPFNKIKKNPYLPLLIQEIYTERDNCYGLYDYSFGNNILINQGITNLDGFKYRFNIFCSDNPNIDIFNNFDFNKYKLGISGSAITACLQQKHPLMLLVAGDTEVEKFINYFDEYYDNSDIDVMFLGDNDNFYNGSNELLKTITINLEQIYIDVDIKMELITTYSVFVGHDFIKNNINIDDLCFKSNPISFIQKNIKSEKIISLLKPHYEKLIVEDNKFKANYIFTNIYLKKNISEINVEVSYKYKIISNKLKRSLEIFPIKGNDHFSVISSFHLPNVRGYYNGSNVYLLPSCVSAHLTYINLDYKYFAGSKDPIKILQKNRRRGFGTILSPKELITYKKYCFQYNNNYNNYYNSNLTKLYITDNIFIPKLNKNLQHYNNNLDEITRIHSHSLSRLNTNELYKNYTNLYKYLSIDYAGFIIPFERKKFELLKVLSNDVMLTNMNWF